MLNDFSIYLVTILLHAFRVFSVFFCPLLFMVYMFLSAERFFSERNGQTLRVPVNNSGDRCLNADMRDAKKALAEGQSPYEDLYKKGKAGRRAEDTLAKAKDCISKELVWKVRYAASFFPSSTPLSRRSQLACFRAVFVESRDTRGLAIDVGGGKSGQKKEQGIAGPFLTIRAWQCFATTRLLPAFTRHASIHGSVHPVSA